PPTTGPPLDRRSALQASRPYTVIQDTIRGQQRRGATEAVQIPQSLQVHRRVHGMDVQQSGTISCAMIDAGKNKDSTGCGVQGFRGLSRTYSFGV
ncbi:unnamed protein product, partial [Symbiodinium sp. CCMP2456]